MIGPVPPQNDDAEISVLGSILLYGEMLDEVTPIIGEQHFHNSACGMIFKACRQLHENGSKVDAVLVGEKLEANNDLEEVGGGNFLLELLETVPHAAHAAYYAKIVRENWVRRTVIYACTRAASSAYEPGSNAQEIVSAVQGELAKLDDSLAANDGSSSLSDLLMDVQTEIETGAEPGIKTGYHGIDRLTNGMRKGNLVVIGARPSVGKTALGTCIAMNVATSGKRVLFFSVEMTAKEVAERMLSADSRISMNQLRGGMLEEADRNAVMESSNKLASLPVDIEDSSSWTVPQMAASARIHGRRKGVDLIIVDYLQLITPERGRDNREQQVAAQSRQLKRIAGEVGCPVIVMAQLNREIEKRPNKTPRLSDLRESGAIEQDADIVLLLDRPSDTDVDVEADVAKVIVAKNRNGPKGDVQLKWRAPTMQFVEDDEYAHYDREFSH